LVAAKQAKEVRFFFSAQRLFTLRESFFRPQA
jgi:hypothetical protein